MQDGINCFVVLQVSDWEDYMRASLKFKLQKIAYKSRRLNKKMCALKCSWDEVGNLLKGLCKHGKK